MKSMPSYRLFRLFFVVFIAFCLAMTSLGHLPASAAPLQDETPDITPVIEKYRAEIQAAMRAQHIPGFAIVVVDDQKVLWQEGFGFTDTDRRTPVTVDTPFSIQSMSKSFTALTVLMAVQDGLVDLDTPLSTYLPDFRVNSVFEADAADKITLRHLLSCTAGFTHEAPVGNNYELVKGTFDEHVLSIQDTWLKFPVGQMYAYSNLGVDLAGYIVEQRAGMPFAEYAQKKLLTPLGMRRTTFDIDAIAADATRAIGHDIIINDLPLVAMMPSGGIYATAADMARYLQFHINGGQVDGKTALAQDLLQAMYTPQFPASINEHYGLGIGVGRDHNARLLAHGGGGFGFLSDMQWYPELKLGLAWLSNSATHNLQMGLKERILDDIIALDPVLYAQRSNTKVSAPARNDQGAGLMSQFALASRIKTIAPESSPEEMARWQQYKGVYGYQYFHNIVRLFTVDVNPNGFVTVDGEKVYAFGDGLFLLANGEAINLDADPPTYLNVPLKKLNPVYFWFLRGVSLISLAAFLGAVLALPVIGVVALARRKRAGQQSRCGWPAWLTGLLAWLAALLGILSLGGSMVLPVMIQNLSLTPATLWAQFPALVYGHLPPANPVMAGYMIAWVLLPFAVFALAAGAAVGVWQAWRGHRGSVVGRVLQTVLVALLLVMAVLLW